MSDDLILDPDEMTVGELCEVADIAGDEAVTGLARGVASPKALLALVYIIKRRTDPAYTMEQAKQVKVSSLNFGSPNGKDPDG